ncbi:hypothetical protein AXX12_00255 [Anaerosporomusa subterranea]|uniref:Fis family transcriptional regulator n=1 Tax=Anaerosporomusa subterranea TaxID=1794912 RepID=A0A154BVG7_ANASB|nr:sigma-54 dependent transcriptional regulator [Anaerosporomusa subterranea]KYZ78013.1 hypothetical protein AXX12_00255 [Anaerosporomusa subterranea]
MQILVVDDDKVSRSTITRFLSRLNHSTVECANAEQAIREIAEKTFDLVVSDIRMPRLSGIDLMQTIAALPGCGQLDVVLVTGHGTLESAIEAIRAGAMDYLLKPVDAKDLVRILKQVEDKRKWHGTINAKDGTDVSKNLPDTVHYDGQTMKLGVFSQEMKAVLEQAKLYHLDRSIPVLIQGETGTGKEIVARIIHSGGDEGTQPFIDINCAAITPSLFESEIFGYESGSFTGGSAAGHKGKFDLAEGGTLFLDEVAEIPIELQGKLLRVLEQKTFYRVGGVRKIRTNVRIICATNMDLEDAIHKGNFRQDLFYRLRVGHIVLPPLRKRPNAIVPLALTFLQESAKMRGKCFKRIDEDAAKILSTYEWRGNVRELKNIIEWVVFMFDDEELKPSHLTRLTQRPEKIPAKANLIQTTDAGSVLDDHIEQLVQHALHINDGNKAAAARYLGISRSSLYRILERAAKE